jgi:hypothetical protein
MKAEKSGRWQSRWWFDYRLLLRRLEAVKRYPSYTAVAIRPCALHGGTHRKNLHAFPPQAGKDNR